MQSHNKKTLLEVVLREGGHRYFTSWGGMALAARRVACGVSARRYGVVMMQALHHSTVTRWEVVFVAALQASRTSWYMDREQTLYRAPRSASLGRTYRFVQHLVRGDGTNTMKHRRKFHSCEIQSQYYEINVSDNTTWEQVVASCQSGGGFGDLLEEAHSSAEGCYAMYSKQMASIGCPHWARSVQQFKKSINLQEEHEANIIATYFFGTDSGGNEDKFKNMAADAVSEDCGTMLWSCPCLLHQFHLMVQRSLKLADNICESLHPMMNRPRKYFSSVVKMLHCWRDYSRRIHSRWATLYGLVDATTIKRRPPQALSGRWGAIDAGEAYLLAPERQKVIEVYTAVVTPPFHEKARATGVLALAIAGEGHAVAMLSDDYHNALIMGAPQKKKEGEGTPSR